MCIFAVEKSTNMREAKASIIDQTELVSLYTITFENDELSEFEKFMEKFRDNATLQRDYQMILLALEKITSHGALERNFRPEGKMNDDVVALPIEKSRLRLYCLRLTDKILILGNGGEKNTKTYEESEELSGYVMDLQKFDALLEQEQKNGKIKIEQNVITGIESASFEL